MENFRYKYDRFLPPQIFSCFAEKDEFLKQISFSLDFEKKITASGIPLYRGNSCTYVDTSEDHYIIIGSTSSKKTRNVAMPTIEMLARAEESMIITDSKGELTRRHRVGLERNGYEVIVINFKNFNSDTWNPLENIYNLYHSGHEDMALTQIADFVESLSAPSKNCTKDIYWNLMAESLLQGYLELMLNICKKDEYNINTLLNVMAERNSRVIDRILEIMPHKSIAYNNIQNVKVAPERTYNCIVSTAYSIVKIFLVNKQLSYMLSETSFDMKSIGEKPTAVFLVLPDNKETFNCIISVFVSQLSEVLI